MPIRSYRTAALLSVLLFSVTGGVAGCDDKKDDAKPADKKDGDKADDKAGDKKEEAPANGRKSKLAMQSESEACTKAIRCCEEMVIAREGKVDPAAINLSCSGVAMAADDKQCEAFGMGYGMAAKASFKDKPLPEVCIYVDAAAAAAAAAVEKAEEKAG